MKHIKGQNRSQICIFPVSLDASIDLGRPTIKKIRRSLNSPIVVLQINTKYNVYKYYSI